jgi:hypothetical protein
MQEAALLPLPLSAALALTPERRWVQQRQQRSQEPDRSPKMPLTAQLQVLLLQ